METKTKWIIGISSLLLIGGGIGAAFYFSKPKTKTILLPDGTTQEVPIDDITTGATTTSEGTTPAPELVAGEASDIQYIAEGGSGGGAHAGMTLIKLADGVVASGDVVEIKHPNYNGQFTVYDNNDAYGGSIIYLEIPFKTEGTKDEDGNGIMIDRQKGTVAVMGVPSGSSFTGIAGIRYFTKAESLVRKKAQSEGKSKGFKGAVLRDFIRTAAAKARGITREENTAAIKAKATGTPIGKPLARVETKARARSSFSGNMDLTNTDLLDI